MDHEIVRLLEDAAREHEAAGRSALARHHRTAADAIRTVPEAVSA